MIRLNDFLDRLSILKVLSFFLIMIIVLTLIPMALDLNFGNLFFKFILYCIMLLFFAYELNKIDFDEISFKTALRNEFDSIFEVSDIYHISFIVIANILFVSAIYFILSHFIYCNCKYPICFSNIFYLEIFEPFINNRIQFPSFR